MRTVFSVSILLLHQPCLLEIFHRSAHGFLGDTEVMCDPFHTGPGFSFLVLAVVQINVDELRPLGKLVVFIQLFKIWQLVHLLTQFELAVIPVLPRFRRTRP